MKAQTQTERPFLSHTLTLFLCMSLSLSSCDNLNHMLRVTELRKRLMWWCVYVWALAVCWCMCDVGSKVRPGGCCRVRSVGKGRVGRAKLGLNSQRLGLVLAGGWRAWVINLLSFVLSVCFHEALVRLKVKAVSLKIVCLALQHVLPSGLSKPPLGRGGGCWDKKVGAGGRHRGRASFPLTPATSAKIDHRLQIVILNHPHLPPSTTPLLLTLISLLQFAFG